MTKEQKSAAYYAVVPAPVRYDPQLSPSAKLLYCEITSLCTSKGYCWATNEYFTRLFELSASTISRLISQLERRGHIRIKTVATKTGSERRIYTDVYRVELLSEEGAQGGTQKEQAPQGGCAKTARGAAQKEQGGVRKNRKQNDYQENDYREYPPIAPHSGGGENAVPESDTAPGGDKPRPKPRRTRQKKSVPTHAPERFEQFWEAYPGGGSRLKAVEAWDALAPDDALIDTMAAALKQQMASRMWRDGVGIPHACRWLSNRRWTDKLPEPPRPRDTGGWADGPG